MGRAPHFARARGRADRFLEQRLPVLAAHAGHTTPRGRRARSCASAPRLGSADRPEVFRDSGTPGCLNRRRKTVICELLPCRRGFRKTGPDCRHCGAVRAISVRLRRGTPASTPDRAHVAVKYGRPQLIRGERLTPELGDARLRAGKEQRHARAGHDSRRARVHGTRNFRTRRVARCYDCAPLR
jgi:hypothetical protein